MILHSHRDKTQSPRIYKLWPSVNTVPASVKFSLDIRAPTDDAVKVVEAEIKDSFALVASGTDVGNLNNGRTLGKPCTINVRTDGFSEAANFREDCIHCVSDSAASLFGSEYSKLTKSMVSGAGRDSLFTSIVCPTGMRDGISHSPTE